MPSRAFIDSDAFEGALDLPQHWVLMPSRAFIDSDYAPCWRRIFGTVGLNALTGIY